jgi:4-diphosphocytidyl-2-C-methyl-D-erythritol kinase
MTHARAFAKINLGLVVGPLRDDGKHEVVTVLQRVDLHDDVTLEPADELAVEGFPDDTLVRTSLERLARDAGVEPRWRARIEKRIPVASGLGGGSADAAVALSMANALLARPLSADGLLALAAEIGADVPFFLCDGPRLATGAGAELTPVALPSGYHVVLLVPRDEAKASTAAVYASFDARDGARGFDRRARDFQTALASIDEPRDLAALPLNDLASSRFVSEIRDTGAFRADVSGAGPAAYGLFEAENDAISAAEALERFGWTSVTRPVTGH